MTDGALHVVTRVLLRLCSPLRTHAILARIGAFLPSRHERSEIERARAHLMGQGSCLSRAITLAARIPDADVVIGVRPRSGEPLFAHAWLEREGAAIDPADVEGTEIARMRGGARGAHVR